jgi:hypothetical protein
LEVTAGVGVVGEASDDDAPEGARTTQQDQAPARVFESDPT